MVDAVIAYETVLPAQAVQRSDELQSLVKSGKIKVITLTSSQSAKNLFSLLNSTKQNATEQNASHSEDLRARKLSIAGVSIASIGAQTRETVERLFACESFQGESATIEGLVTAIARHSQNIKGSP
jgi:uroporphyrinogen-III synthase